LIQASFPLEISMRKLLIFTLLALIVLATSAMAGEEKGFIPIFNGRDLTGWNVAANPDGFRVEDGCMYTGGNNVGTGLLSTEDDYGNFIFRLEYMLSEVGNSGVMIRADSVRSLAWENGYEIQLLAPWTPWRDDLHCTGSIYGHVAITNRPDETTGKWHEMEIVCDRFRIIIAVDGKVTTWADMSTIESLSAKNLSGPLGLQDNHSATEQWVKFRNLRIRNLDREPDYVAKGFAYTNPRVRKQAHAAAVGLDTLMVAPLCELLAQEDSVSYAGAKKALFEVVAAASAPDAPVSVRSSVIETLKAQAAEIKSETGRHYLTRLMGMLEN
jgi:3-keto-disaccharide hydrolase